MTELRQADSRLLAIASASNEAIVGIGPDGRITFWNAAAERIFGRRAAEIMGRPFDDILPARYRDAAAYTQTGLIDGRRRDGSEFPMQITTAKEDGSYTAVIRDLTELETRNRDLERSNAALEQFAAIASHDLSAPLRTIQAFLRLLERRHADELSGEAREFVSHAVKASIRMQRLIDDLLIYSRVGTSQRPPERVDTARVVEEVVQSLDAARHVRWSGLPAVEAHRSELTQLFQNLIGNALKFVPEEREPHVEIGAVRDGRHWRFTVDDNGIGIDPALGEELFEPFRRGADAEGYDGTGVGLAIARKVVEQHGGRLWVQPKDGDGSRFCFTLPA
jgi:PAS domain S-box-containing protein